MPHPLRARFADDIIAEFFPSKKNSNKVIIFCDGMPGMPGNKKLQAYVSKKGYWSFFPRYRGTWESGGQFLAKSPHEDILDVAEGLSKPFTSIWDGVRYQIDDPEIYVVGSSFGGTAAILCSIDKRVTKAVAISPVVDWPRMEESETEPMDWLERTMRSAFGEAYRFDYEDWEELSQGAFYNPIDYVDDIDSHKLMIIHAKDDDVVLYEPVADFASKTQCQLITLKKGGHLGSRTLMKWRVRRKFWKFLEI